MKNLTLLFAFILTGIAAQAKHFDSEMNLKLYDNAHFTVILDNNSYGGASNNFVFKNLKPGRHYLKVFRKHYKPYGHGSFSSLEYKGWITIPANKVLFAQINPYQQFSVVQSYAKHSYQTNYYYNDYESYGDEDCEPVNSYNSFDALKMTIEKQSFDQTKLKVAKQAIASNSFRAAQIKELMLLLDFDSNKLDLAKYAYGYTTDKHNYFMVNDAFDFDSSIHALDQYIAANY
jgi:hypothetical protein